MIVPASGIFGVDRGDVSDDELMAGLKVGTYAAPDDATRSHLFARS